MLPYLDLFGVWQVPTHGLFFLLGALVARMLAQARLSQDDFRAVDNSIPAMVLGSLVGARAFFVASRPDVWSDPLSWFRFWEGGMVSYGGLVGALGALFLVTRWKERTPGPVFDALGPCLLVGWGIGRLGCLLSWYGEEGTVTTVPWAVTVAGVSRHPVMLYLSLSLIVGGVLFRRKGRAEACLLYYAVVRLVFDRWRDYEPDHLLLYSQAACVVLATAALILWRIRGRIPEAVVESTLGEK